MASTANHEADAVIRVCSYHRKDFDLVLVRSHPQSSLSTDFQSASIAGLSTLDDLPREVLSMVLQELDILSFFHFRQVNRQSRAISTNLWKYRMIASHGLEGLGALLRTKLAHLFTVEDLYQVLTTSACSICGSFGAFLFLINITRCCFHCIQTSAKLRVVCPSALSKITHISTKRLQRLLGSLLHTIPGLYSMEEHSVKRPKHIVGEQQAIETLLSLSAVTPQSVRDISLRNSPVSQRFMACTAFPWYNVDEVVVEHGISCKGCQCRLEDESGTIKNVDDRDRVFSTESFMTHFESCLEAQSMWTMSQGGTKLVEEPEFTRRCGYINRFDRTGFLR